MNKKKQKTNEKTKEPKPEDFKTQATAEEAAEEYIKSQPIYTILNFFIGGRNEVHKVNSDVEGKPPTY